MKKEYNEKDNELRMQVKLENNHLKKNSGILLKNFIYKIRL